MLDHVEELEASFEVAESEELGGAGEDAGEDALTEGDGAGLAAGPESYEWGARPADS